jgi:signal-transduction protein with cAMP-binding, CBS, and nucleotidyltransferase domain
VRDTRLTLVVVSRRFSSLRIFDSQTLGTDFQRQALRKRIGNELSRKRTISTTQHSSRRRGSKPNVVKGTVAALKPSPALTVPDTITVAEASQLCAAKRTDCVLVVDDEEGLSGIFTAKGLAYRVRPKKWSMLFNTLTLSERSQLKVLIPTQPQSVK